MSKGLGIAEFLNHSSRGGGGKILSWREDGRVTAFLHPLSPIYPVWRHNWFEVAEVEDKETGDKTRKVFARRFVCHERELINKKSRFRDKKTGEREYPPEVCPMDMMLDQVVQLVRKGKLKWTDPVFRFEGDDPDSEYNVTLTAAGLYGGYRGELTKEQVAELRRAHIDRREAWREDVRSKLSYIFQVISVASPGDGIVTMIEPAMLADRMKSEIGKVMKRKGREGGDPTLHPYPLEIVWNKDEEDISKTYDVTALEDPPSAEVLEHFKQKPESIDQYTAPGDCVWLLASMREACQLAEGLLDFDAIFAAAEKAGLMVEKEFNEGLKPDDETPDGDDAPVGDVKGAAGSQLYECDHCGAETMGETELKCSACGAEYDETGLTARPCNECKAIIQLPEKKGDAAICPKCASIHAEKDGAWMTTKKGGAAKEKEAPVEEKKPARKRFEVQAEKAEKKQEKATSPKPEGKPASEGKPTAAASKKASGDKVPFSE
jgi:hypothetical protein